MSIVTNNTANPYAGLTTQSTASSGASGSTSATPASSELNQNEFLKLMITQLNNQDPTKPMDSAQFMGQLAQFATVTGIQNLQSTVSKLANSVGPARAMQASNLLNHQVMVTSKNAYLPKGGSLSGALDLPNGASDASVDICDASGQVVKHLDLGAQQSGMAKFSWSGLNDKSQQLPAGTYTIKASATVGGKNVAPGVLVNSKVTGVSLGANNSSVNLNLQGLGTVSLSDVRSID